MEKKFCKDLYFNKKFLDFNKILCQKLVYYHQKTNIQRSQPKWNSGNKAVSVIAFYPVTGIKYHILEIWFYHHHQSINRLFRLTLDYRLILVTFWYYRKKKAGECYKELINELINLILNKDKKPTTESIFISAKTKTGKCDLYLLRFSIFKFMIEVYWIILHCRQRKHRNLDSKTHKVKHET